VHREDVFVAWAPPSAAWSLWVKPVPFAQMPDDIESTAPARSDTVSQCDVSWASSLNRNALIVVDLPGEESVHVGMALARHGYRPVPLFNACTGPRELVDQRRIQAALHDSAAQLQALPLLADAPPAFLLDELRAMTVRPAQAGAFDNRWRVYAEDFPTVDTLKARGVIKAILVQHRRQPLARDLHMVLWLWERAGIAMALKEIDDTAAPRPMTLPRPWWLQRFFERLLQWMGVRRRPAGGFGYVIPEPRHG
jgi:hypothetical protein